MSSAASRVAVIGAGMAGATCGRLLADAGFEVHLFDKSRGVGGRMATRRVEWASSDGVAHRSRFDHGTPGFTAQSRDFAQVAEQAQRDGLLSRWVPAMAPGSYAPLGEAALWVPTPDMPAWCRSMVSGLPVQTNCTVEALRRAPTGWQLENAGVTLADGFAAVIVAIAPLQAEPLLRPHQPGWAQLAKALPMVPCWTLMGVTDDAGPAEDWSLAWPTSEPLACIVRNDAKPGRERESGVAHWVAHATAAWSHTHLEAPAADVQARLQEALSQWVGRSLSWHHSAVHRWRYASVPRAAQTAGRCWWDAGSGLGVCGDALSGGGVEGAWLSARALATAVIEGRLSPATQGLNDLADSTRRS